MSSRRSSSSSKSSSSKSSSKNIQKTIDLLLQSTEGDAKTILAKITDIDFLYKIFKIELFDINSDKAGKIRSLIHIRIIQVLIKNTIEEQLKRYEERRIELEERFRLIKTNVLRLINEIGFQQLNESIILSNYQLNRAKELHRTAKELLQLSVKSGDIHIKQGEIEDGVKRVGDALDLLTRLISHQIRLLKIILQERKERISHSDVGKLLLQKKLKRGQSQPKNRD